MKVEYVQTCSQAWPGQGKEEHGRTWPRIVRLLDSACDSSPAQMFLSEPDPANKFTHRLEEKLEAV